MQDRGLWERALVATGNGAVREEEAVEPEIAAMAIANPELAAEPGMGNVRQNRKGYRYITGMRSIGYFLIDY